MTNPYIMNAEQEEKHIEEMHDKFEDYANQVLDDSPFHDSDMPGFLTFLLHHYNEGKIKRKAVELSAMQSAFHNLSLAHTPESRAAEAREALGNIEVRRAKFPTRIED